ncbi:chromosomal replication initiator protein DnaA [Candidatus Shapirobacteria bacterium CG08_land_8_20_14_0_20_39_18]|uniref:Chromosomal replication initiator protein DnaA n=1 Tax=Candidatus Shapirobacteria bacterium CG08_land_8_20_14_0_20_39_18 TaxID=1974883 RepID=A0A2M6XCR9_9BACT|nr:MAG: chromosomal replication initiator protein DnaA [Candidatus Shapirobacteria bacterium CG08_land_8_20_14_0_20_39_18]PIY65101.1 MAG: chromosomal replication initiator protein DnaA [Candidatus Shapirobacteria bacterium CG_4_10_14_0_8_um_filter_39_15]PJE68186.1 MAG: chromosomal replication initiator protein DnaA [Candidatus Shapirobacteria bacterium CG10_big_fil_rev_8_21_14_0_10_38_8]
MDNNNLWQRVLEELRLSVSKPYYQTLFLQTTLISLENNVATVSCTNPYVQGMIENRYYSLLKSILDSQTKNNNSLVFVIKTITKQESKEIGPLFEKEAVRKPVFDTHTGLNPKYTFSSFVVGNSNNFAHAAAQAIIQNPGGAYNPFFIWGGVGVGKTHLMQAIGHAILEKNSDFKVLYTPSENFTNELVQALQDKNISVFKKRYRSIDVFLVDDIQFISGKEYSQEEFFHTFNALYMAGKQIVLTSDRPPSEITKVEERLISRFMGGLTVDIQAPDYETRLAILKAKRLEKNLTIDDAVLDIIAQNISSNTRELEGLLSQLVTQASSSHTELNTDFAKSFFGIQKQKTSKILQPKNVIAAVSRQFQIKTSDLTGVSRRAEFVFPRQIIMYLLRDELKIPLVKIGEMLGGRDHTTIIHGSEKIRQLFNNDASIKQQIMLIKQTLSE